MLHAVFSHAMIGYTKVRFKFVLILISLSVLFAFFTPFSASVDNGNLIVDLGYARYEGKARPNGVSQWQGMRYAAPPVGKLRFAKPHDPPRTTKLQKARKVRPASLLHIWSMLSHHRMEGSA